MALAQDATLGTSPPPRPEQMPRPPRTVVATPATQEPWIGDDGGRAASYPPTAAAAPLSADKPLTDDMCRLDGSTRPPVFGPGEQGKLYLIAALQDLIVLRSSADLQLGYEKDQNGVRLGNWLLPPPAAGSRAPGFPNLPVYAETAIVEVPITIAADAAPGLHEIALHCAVELFDGDAGRSRGRFQRDLTFGIVVRGRADEPVPEFQSRLLPVAAAAPQPQPVAEPSPPPAADGADPLSWLLVGGAVLVLLVALLTVLHRRR